MARKLALCVVDSLRTDMLERCVADGTAPTFAALLDRGQFVRRCVSSFPSVTPVCSAEIVTGERPDRHCIPAMNWFHRAEGRYVEYGSSFEASRAFGLFRSLYDTVYNMNLGHLSHEVETVFERLGDAGVRTACTPFLVYRGRTRHELGLEGLLRRVATAAQFHHATWGPDELFYGELYSSRRVPCRPTLARPGTRDEYSACVGRELVDSDLYDFLLFSLPDNDYHSHRFGPAAQPESIAHADAAMATLVEAGGGIDRFCDDHAVILCADHAQSAVEHPLPLTELLGSEWRVLGTTDSGVGDAELAVSPSARAAGVYVLGEGRRAERNRDRVVAALRDTDGVDLLAWMSGDEAAIARDGAELRFVPGSQVEDTDGNGWDVDGDLGVLEAEPRDGRLESEAYPDPLARVWAALANPNAGDVIVSATPGWELVDWGGVTHCPGGSHGSLDADDSLVPLVAVGLDSGLDPERERWRIADIAGLILEHFGIGDHTAAKTAAAAREPG
jgi:Type I phosphodiesterase / nucleotide pyrophosphatase